MRSPQVSVEALVGGDLVEKHSERGIEVAHTVSSLNSKNGAPCP